MSNVNLIVFGSQLHPAGIGSQLRALALADESGLVYHRYDEERISVEQNFGLHSLLRQLLPQLMSLTRLEVRQLTDAHVLKYAPLQLLKLCVYGPNGIKQSHG